MQQMFLTITYLYTWKTWVDEQDKGVQMLNSKGQLTAAPVRKSCKSSWSQTRAAPQTPADKRESICFSFLSTSGAQEHRHAPRPNRTLKPFSNFISLHYFSQLSGQLVAIWKSVGRICFPWKQFCCSFFCTEPINSLRQWKFTVCFMFRFA